LRSAKKPTPQVWRPEREVRVLGPRDRGRRGRRHRPNPQAPRAVRGLGDKGEMRAVARQGEAVRNERHVRRRKERRSDHGPSIARRRDIPRQPPPCRDDRDQYESHYRGPDEQDPHLRRRRIGSVNGCAHRFGSAVRARRQRLQISDKSISAFGQRLDEARGVGRVSQGVPQAIDGLVEPSIEVDEGVSRPQLLLQLVTCDDLARLGEEQREDRKRLLAEPKLQALLPQFARAQVGLERVEPNETPLAIRCGHCHPRSRHP
jgi:hypothetical protein